MNGFTVELPSGIAVTLSAVAPGIVRLQAVGKDGPTPSLLERYGFIEPLTPPSGVEVQPQARLAMPDGTSLRIGDGRIELSRRDDVIASIEPSTKYGTSPFSSRNEGCQLDLLVHDDERFVGFGDHQRTSFLLNGRKSSLWVKYPTVHVPVPLLLSSRGYALFFNTTRKLHYDVAAADATRARFAIEKEYLDVFLIYGDGFDQLIERYTALTGRPQLPPLKSFGFWLLLHAQASGHDVLSVAKTLRDEKIPCDNIGLEPGWTEKWYDDSVNKEWNTERFRGWPNPEYRAGPAHMIHALGRMGFALGLWLCSKWDFTWEEERRIGSDPLQPESPPNLEGVEISHHDENVGHKPLYMDPVTVRTEPYFKHLSKFVNDGVRFFKSDPSWLINEFPDRLYGNRRTDDEMHNLVFQLCAKQMCLDYEQHAKKRSYGLVVAGWAGIQRYPGTWAGDTGGGKQSLVGILQDAVVGHAFTTCDLAAGSVAGIHMGFLLPWALLNSWAYFHYPGFQGEQFDSIYRDYSSLRMRLLPYLYSLAYRSTQTGKAIARPMFLEHPHEPAAFEQLSQYYLGDSLLVSAHSDSVWLPKGRWMDFWSGQVVEGDGQPRALPIPSSRGGHLLVREGAIIPTAPVRQHADTCDWDTLTWLLLPGNKPSRFTLYLDDGDGLQHREGAFAKVDVLVSEVANRRVRVSWSEPGGSQTDRLSRVRHRFVVLPEWLSPDSVDFWAYAERRETVATGENTELEWVDVP